MSRANQLALEAISAIRVVSAYSLQAEVASLYKQVLACCCCCFDLRCASSHCACTFLQNQSHPLFALIFVQNVYKANLNKTAHFSGIAFGMSQVYLITHVLHAVGAGCCCLLFGLHSLQHTGLSKVVFCHSQFILFGVFCLSFWYGGKQVAQGNIAFEDMMKVFTLLAGSCLQTALEGFPGS